MRLRSVLIATLFGEIAAYLFADNWITVAAVVMCGASTILLFFRRSFCAVTITVVHDTSSATSAKHDQLTLKRLHAPESEKVAITPSSGSPLTTSTLKPVDTQGSVKRRLDQLINVPADDDIRPTSAAAVEQSNAPHEHQRVSFSATEISKSVVTRESVTGSTVRRTTESRAILPVGHFERHAGVPGYLYLAHNPEHQTQVFKAGYAIVDPRERVEGLNLQQNRTSHVGSFELIHYRLVNDSYRAEQLLFELLFNRRIALSREFFWGEPDELILSMNSVASRSKFDDTSLTGLYSSTKLDTHVLLNGGEPKPDQAFDSAVDANEANNGWICIFRNPVYRVKTYRIDFTTRSPNRLMNRLNAMQRGLTSQIGFFKLVHCVATIDPGTAHRYLMKQLHPYRIHSRKHFFNAPLDAILIALARAIEESNSAREFIEKNERSSVGQMPDRLNVQQPDRSLVTGHTTLLKSSHVEARAITVKIFFGNIPCEIRPWVVTCHGCGQNLRLTAAIGAVDDVTCPRCLFTLRYRQGPRGSSPVSSQ